MNELSDDEGPTFGSDAWLRRSLLAGLVEARKRVDQVHQNIVVSKDGGVDLDAYAHVRVPRRQRKVWKLLEELANQNSWIRLQPNEGIPDIVASAAVGGKRAEDPSAEAVVAVLQEIGVEATVDRSFR